MLLGAICTIRREVKQIPINYKKKNKNGFDNGQIVMARWLEYLWGDSSVEWFASIRSGAIKWQWWTCNSFMGSQGSLMQMGSKDWPRWYDPTDEPPLLKLFKWLMLILIIDRCHTWGRITVEQSGCPCWCTSLKTPTMSTWASELDTQQRKKVAWACGSPGAYASLTWKH